MIENINLDKTQVSAELHGYMYAAVYATNGVFNCGNKLGYELVSNNEIKIKDGLLLNAGRFMRIVGTESLAIENGTTGVTRYDLIVARFETDGINESHTLKVIKGAEGGGVPEATQEDVYNGGSIHELPLYSVYINGLSVQKVEQKFNAIASTEAVAKRAGNENLIINGDFKIWQRGSIFSNAENKYCADRFYIANAKSPTELVEKSTVVPNNNFENSIHIKDNTTENTYLRYRLETGIKGTLTLSFWYKTNVKFNTYIYDESYKLLGSSNSTNQWTKAAFTFEATNLTHINLIHAVNVGEIYITGVKLERGAEATDFMPQPYQQQLLICQRYFQKLSNHVIKQQYYLNQYYGVQFETQMRTKPTVTNIAMVKSSDGTQLNATADANAQGVYKFYAPSTYTETSVVINSFEADAEIY